GQEKVLQAIGGPWAIRYTLSHLVKDEETLAPEDWKRTHRILPHGALAAGYLTGNFDVISVSAAASTGIMNLKTCKWSPFILVALADPKHRQLAKKQWPRIVPDGAPVGYVHPSMLGLEARVKAPAVAVFPSSDDQAAGLVGGGAVDAGQMAVILGNSAVVNSSSSQL